MSNAPSRLPDVERLKDAVVDAASEVVSGVTEKARSASAAVIGAETEADYEKRAAKLFTDGAAAFKSATEHLSGERIDELIRASERFARRSPVAFIGATVAAGFILSRIGKAAAADGADQAAD